MTDVLEVRRTLDALCAELACERITPQASEALKNACQDFEQSVHTGDSQIGRASCRERV